MFHLHVPCFCYHSIPACSCSVSKVTHLHNFCITCLTKQRSLFRFSQKIAFLPYHTCLSFIMYEYVSSPCSLFWYHSVPLCSRWLSRAIHLHILSCLAGAQFTVCMTYLTLQIFLFWFPQTNAFSSVYLCLNSNTSEYVSRPCFIHL